VATGGNSATLPGEKYVRNFTATPDAGQSGRYNCPYYELCAFHFAGNKET